jgi:hypothetical protein
MAGILGVRAQGHAAHPVVGRQPWAARRGLRRLRAPRRCHEMRWERRKGGERRLTGWAHMAVIGGEG